MAITLKVPATKWDHYIGSLEAPVILVEYADLEAANTARGLSVVDRLLAEFREDLCFVFRHFPVPDENPSSVMAAFAAEAAHAQGKFWKMFRHLLRHQNEFSPRFFMDSARTLGLEEEQFLSDMESEEIFQKIQKDIDGGGESGVEEIPSFFLNGIIVEGPTNYELLRHEIRGLLQENRASF